MKLQEAQLTESSSGFGHIARIVEIALICTFYQV
jgi:hypothetical protein